MNRTQPGDASGVWLAGTVLTLLEQRYGPGRIPSVRALTRQIRDANDGARISHGQVHNILNGSAANITDRTRAMLARFLGVSAAHLVPPAGAVPAQSAAAPAGAAQAEAAQTGAAPAEVAQTGAAQAEVAQTGAAPAGAAQAEVAQAEAAQAGAAQAGAGAPAGVARPTAARTAAQAAVEAVEAGGDDPAAATRLLAMRLSLLRPEELAAIEKAIDMVRSRDATVPQPDEHGTDGRDRVTPDSSAQR